MSKGVAWCVVWQKVALIGLVTVHYAVAAINQKYQNVVEIFNALSVLTVEKAALHEVNCR